jgi:hypothetical protein
LHGRGSALPAILLIQTTSHQADTPAQAGVHFDFSLRIEINMDSSFRWNDELEIHGG